MSTEETREIGRGDAPEQRPQSEPRNDPPAHDPNVISDADRAANPFGAARREREMHRDEAGKFAPKPESDKQAKPEGQKDGEKPDDGPRERQRQQGQVPNAALHDERGRRQAAESELATLRREVAELRGLAMGRQQQPQAPQKPMPPPEFWQDPNAAMEHRLREAMSPLQREAEAARQRSDQQRLGMSQMFAVQVHGQEAVQGALDALRDLRGSNPGEYQRLEALAERSFDPVGDVVRWHKQTTAMREIGGDPEAWFQRRLAEWQAQQGQHHGGGDPPPAPPRQPVQHGQLPSSFAHQRGGGPRGGQAYGGPRALDDIMGR